MITMFDTGNLSNIFMLINLFIDLSKVFTKFQSNSFEHFELRWNTMSQSKFSCLKQVSFNFNDVKIRTGFIVVSLQKKFVVWYYMFLRRRHWVDYSNTTKGVSIFVYHTRFIHYWSHILQVAIAILLTWSLDLGR